jgi:hypothetical protein
MSNDQNDRFGVPDSALLSAAEGHAMHGISRTGLYVPTRLEVATMPLENLRPILIDWMWESPSELIPTNHQILEVKKILEERDDSCIFAELINECAIYIAD